MASSVFPEVVGQFGLDEERSGALADRSVRPLNNTVLVVCVRLRVLACDADSSTDLLEGGTLELSAVV
jgi:hypothetical protein